MQRVIASYSHYEVIKINKGYVVKDCCGSSENHAHFDKEGGALRALYLIKHRRYPKGAYMTKALIRVLGEDILSTYARPKRKEKYVNRR